MSIAAIAWIITSDDGMVGTMLINEVGISITVCVTNAVPYLICAATNATVMVMTK
jgi:hypothetical protein